MTTRIGQNGSPNSLVQGEGPIAPRADGGPRIPAGGLEQATEHGQAPSAGGRLPPMSLDGVAPPQGGSHVAARGFDPTRGPKMFAFVPENAPKSVGFVEVLKGVGRSPEAAKLVQGLVADIEARVGLALPEQIVQAALHKPELLTNVMALSPKEMKAGFHALHRTPARNLMAPAEKTRQLPKTFDFAKLDETPIELPPQKDLVEIAPGLYRGGQRDPKVSDADAKARIVLAEVMDRLADNANVAPKDRFTVKYEGGEYSRLSTFLEALAEHGHTVEARVDHRVADFLDLKADTPDGLRSVAAPVFVRTGVEDAKGNEAVVPAVHSEIVYTITPGPKTKGQKVSGETKWYQGVPHTGFFASGITEKGDWTGTVTTQRFSGAEAVRAAQLSGLFSDVINDATKQAALPMAGYGDTGVCIDSVATILRAMNEKITAYPLLQGDELLSAELKGRLEANVNRQDAPEYRLLQAAVDGVPSDAAGALAGRPDLNLPSSRSRALTSLPWAPGAEPLASAALARQILGG